MPPQTGLAKKLLLKPGLTFLIVAAPDNYHQLLPEASAGMSESDHVTGRTFDLVQIFVRGRADLEAKFADGAVGGIKPNGILWITYPKQTGTIKSDINRDSLARIVAIRGWRPVTQISVDDTWSALRVRAGGASRDVGRSLPPACVQYANDDRAAYG